jgi:uncharacterized membrane protein
MMFSAYRRARKDRRQCQRIRPFQPSTVHNTGEVNTDMHGPGGNQPVSPPIVTPASSMVGWTQFIYALHAFSLLTGIIGAATVVGAFLTGWPSIIAVILNYVKRGDVRGTWLESHFRWQIRTFWFGLLWVSLCILFVIVTLGLGILIAWLPMAVVGLWFIYRIVRGWLALSDRRPMYT